MTEFAKIRVGSTVEILVHGGLNRDGSIHYVNRAGRAVMRGPYGWVLNMGGRFGTPQICDKTNFVRISSQNEQTEKEQEEEV